MHKKKVLRMSNKLDCLQNCTTEGPLYGSFCISFSLSNFLIQSKFVLVCLYLLETQLSTEKKSILTTILDKRNGQL